MHGNVPVTLLETTVLADVMQIITSDDDGPLHLQLLHDSSENASADANVAGEGALLVDVGSIDGLFFFGGWVKYVLVCFLIL